jgi:hypothetical protein
MSGVTENFTVAVGGGTNSIITSRDGVNWTGLGTSTFSTEGLDVAWNGSLWVAVGQGTNTIATSPDGTNWTGRTSPFTTRGIGIAWNGSLWVAVGEGTHTIATSPDGINWTGRGTSIFSTAGNSVAWNGNLWVAVGQGTNTIAYSYDGINWIGNGIGIFSITGFDVAWNGSLWVAVGWGASHSIATSPNGITWTGRGVSTFSVFGSGVAWNGSLWVAVGWENNTIATSTDGISWVGQGATIFTQPGYGVVWNGSLWIATGSGGGANTLITSANGTSWTQYGNTLFSTNGRRPASRSVLPYIGSYVANPPPASAGTVAAPSYSFYMDLSSGVYLPSPNNVGVVTAGIERIRVGSNGRVGIGVTVPTVTLDISGDVSANVYNGPGGTAGAPHFTSSDDRTTGIFMPASGREVGFSSFGTERARVDLSGLRIVNGTIRNLSGTVSAPSYTFFNDLSMGLYDPATNVLGFVTSGVERMRIDPNGLVGIGTVGPVFALDVSGSARVDQSLHVNNRANTNGGLRLTSDGSSAFIQWGSNTGSPGTGNFNLRFTGINADGDYMTITSNGNVGINRTPTTGKLEIASTSAANTMFPALVLRSGGPNSNASHRIGLSNPNNYGAVVDFIEDSGANFNSSLSLKSSANGTLVEGIRIAANGTVGIGTTTPDRALLHVNGSVSFTDNLYGWFNSTTITGPVSATRSNSIYGNQQIWAGGGFAVNSDMRIKKDISDVDDETALSDLRKLKPKTYKYIDEYYRGKYRVYGFIAQDVRETLPYAVSYEKEEIPNIYDTAQCVPLTDISGTCVTLTTKNATFDLSQTDICGSFITHPTVILLDKQNTKIYSKLVDIVSSNTFTIDTTLSNDDYFVFGQEVTDFHVMKKDAIFTVATAATQELDRQLQAAKAKIQTLEDTLSNVITRLSALEA